MLSEFGKNKGIVSTIIPYYARKRKKTKQKKKHHGTKWEQNKDAENLWYLKSEFHNFLFYSLMCIHKNYTLNPGNHFTYCIGQSRINWTNQMNPKHYRRNSPLFFSNNASWFISISKCPPETNQCLAQPRRYHWLKIIHAVFCHALFSPQGNFSTISSPVNNRTSFVVWLRGGPNFCQVKQRLSAQGW